MASSLRTDGTEVATLRERFLRVEALGLPTDEVTKRMGISESELARWITGSLPVEEADIIEVGLAMLEVRQRRMETTQRIHRVTAA